MINIKNDVIYKQIQKQQRGVFKSFVSDVCNNLENPDFFTPYTDEELDTMFSDGCIIIGAFLENKLVGFGVLIINDKIGELDGAMVLPDYRNMGIQTNLIKQRLDISEKRGFEKIIVKAHPDNKASIKAICKNGFLEKETIMSHGKLRKLFEINTVDVKHIDTQCVL